MDSRLTDVDTWIRSHYELRFYYGECDPIKVTFTVGEVKMNVNARKADIYESRYEYEIVRSRETAKEQKGTLKKIPF